jgi:chemotaxis protein CheC
MIDQREIWDSLITGPRSGFMLRRVMWRVMSGFSKAMGRVISNNQPTVKKVPIARVSELAGGPETKMVGVYIVIGGSLYGQAILILPMTSALNVADLMMGNQPGAATELGIMEQSALSEVGNMAVSHFLSGVSTLDQMPDLLRPSPPAVMVDMLGAILDVIITPVATVRDDLIIIETTFKDTHRTVRGRFWVLPDPALLDLAV